MWLVEDMCYADNSANTTLQCKTGTKHHSLINYIHIIQLEIELDTELTKSLQATLLPQRMYHSQEHAKPVSSRQSTGAPALLKIDFYSLLLSFIAPNTSKCIVIFWIITIIILFMLIFLSILMQSRRVCLCKKLF